LKSLSSISGDKTLQGDIEAGRASIASAASFVTHVKSVALRLFNSYASGLNESINLQK
jgi:hypothetical protein